MVSEARSGEDRRVHKRTDTSVPVALRISAQRSGETVSETVHCIITDVSLGGLRVELVGHAAKLFADGNLGALRVELSFVLPSLADVAPVACNVRWSRPITKGWSLGLQVVGVTDALMGRILAVITPTSRPAGQRYVWPAAAVIGVAVILSLVMKTSSLQSERDGLRQRVDALATQLTESTQKSDQVVRQLETSTAQAESLQARYSRCIAADAARQTTAPSAAATAVERAAEEPEEDSTE